MDIDFIKWLCEVAEGFMVEGREVDCGLCVYFSLNKRHLEENKNWNSFFFPLLLHRAIEGLNKKSVEDGIGYLIDINCSDITVYHTDDTNQRLYEHVNHSIDQSKESALKYIYEQEKK